MTDHATKMEQISNCIRRECKGQKHHLSQCRIGQYERLRDNPSPRKFYVRDLNRAKRLAESA